MAYGHLAIALLMFIVFCNFQFDGKYGARFFDKPIPQNSVWRKIYPFRERETNPLLYVKWIPCVISFIILIVVLIIFRNNFNEIFNNLQILARGQENRNGLILWN